MANSGSNGSNGNMVFKADQTSAAARSPVTSKPSSRSTEQTAQRSPAGPTQQVEELTRALEKAKLDCKRANEDGRAARAARTVADNEVKRLRKENVQVGHHDDA